MLQLVVRIDQVLAAFVISAHVYELSDAGDRTLIALRSDTVYEPEAGCAHDEFAWALRSMATWAERMTHTPTYDLSWGDLDPR